jgi:hypothetical protein
MGRKNDRSKPGGEGSAACLLIDPSFGSGSKA